MSWRGKWVRIAGAAGLMVALLVVSPALGGPSLRKLVKKEVAKQISKARGPAGANGLNGANGAAGVAGTARAYARVLPASSTPCAPCTFNQSKGVDRVDHPGTGHYCVDVPGVDATQESAVASVDWGITANPEGNASAQVQGNDASNTCGTRFSVRTERIPASGAASAVAADDVGFQIVVP